MTKALPDLYAVLGLARDATPAEVNAAFRSLVRRFHPDTRAPGTSSENMAGDAMLRQVVTAYQTLRDPDRRSEYDKLTSSNPHRPADACIHRACPRLARPKTRPSGQGQSIGHRHGDARHCSTHCDAGTWPSRSARNRRPRLLVADRRAEHAVADRSTRTLPMAADAGVPHVIHSRISDSWLARSAAPAGQPDKPRDRGGTGDSASACRSNPLGGTNGARAGSP
jgi:hypothetical protein